MDILYLLNDENHDNDETVHGRNTSRASVSPTVCATPSPEAPAEEQLLLAGNVALEIATTCIKMAIEWETPARIEKESLELWLTHAVTLYVQLHHRDACHEDFVPAYVSFPRL